MKYKVKNERVLLLASYCGDENENNCSENFPCDDCLQMCNVAVVKGDIDVIGGFDYLKSLEKEGV